MFGRVFNRSRVRIPLTARQRRKRFRRVACCLLVGGGLYSVVLN